MQVPRGCAHYAHYDLMPYTLKAKMEKMAFEHGLTYDSYLITEPNREYFWSKNMSGVVGFRRLGRYINLPGGLIAADEDKNRLLSDIMEFAKLNRFTVSVYSVTDKDLNRLRVKGFQVNKLGEDTVLNLADCHWKGKSYQWVRRQSNFCRRHGLVVEEISSSVCDRIQWERQKREIQRLSDLHLSTKTQAGEMQLLEGQLLFEDLQRRRLFIAKNINKGQRIESFVIINPYADGTGWGVEMYRHLPDAVRGAMPFLIHQVVEILKTEGVREVSLCMVPFLRCNEKIKGENALVRRLIVFWSNHFNFLWDSRGLYHFKSRFRPRFLNLYVCVYPKVSIGSIIAFNAAIGVFNLRLGKVLKNARSVRSKKNAYGKPQLAEL